MLNPVGKARKLEDPESNIRICPECNSKLEEEWEEEINEYGEKTGHEFEIYECSNCGYKEYI